MSVDINLSSILSFLAMGGTGIIGYFLKKAFTDFEKKQEVLAVKFEEAAEKFSDQAVRLAVLEEKVERLESAERK